MDFITKDWLILPGGSDINPEIYGKKNYKSYVSDYSKQRDAKEIEEYRKAVSEGRPILGICRGHQLISALNGLTLIQDMSHGMEHYIQVRNLETDEFDRRIKVNDAHHQLVYTNNELEGENFKVYGYCKLSKHHLYQEDEEVQVEIEPEIIHFPKINALGVQFHPEWMVRGSYNKTLSYLEQLVNKLF
ncbi:SNO glutamine amidotransferase family protein [Leptolyngbya phage Lbo-JY46]